MISDYCMIGFLTGFDGFVFIFILILILIFGF